MPVKARDAGKCLDQACGIFEVPPSLRAALPCGAGCLSSSPRSPYKYSPSSEHSSLITMAPRIESSDDSDSDAPLGATNGAAKRANGANTNGNGKRTLSPSAVADSASKPVVSPRIHSDIFHPLSWQATDHSTWSFYLG